MTVSTGFPGAVLENEVLPRRTGDGALRHLDILADTMLLMHHVVARLELERVDLFLAPGGHPAHVLGGRALAGDVLTGQNCKTMLLVDKTMVQQAGGDHDDVLGHFLTCLLYTSPSPRDGLLSRMPS